MRRGRRRNRPMMDGTPRAPARAHRPLLPSGPGGVQRDDTARGVTRTLRRAASASSVTLTACANSPWVTFPTEDSPRGLWRSLGKRVGFTPSGVQIPYPPRRSDAGRTITVRPASLLVPFSAVACPSGQRSAPRKRVWGQPHRGFKSHRHRQSTKAPSPWGAFARHRECTAAPTAAVVTSADRRIDRNADNSRRRGVSVERW